MSIFSNSSYGLPKVIEAEFLLEFLGDEFDNDKVNRVLTLKDLLDNPSLADEDGKTYAELMIDYLTAIVPNYSTDHAVNKNLGVIVKTQDRFGYYGSEVYYQDDVLGVHIGTKTKDGLEPLVIPITYHEDKAQWGISQTIPGRTEKEKPLTIFSALTIEEISMVGDKKLYIAYLNMTNPRSKASKTTRTRVKLIGGGENTSFKVETAHLQNCFFEENPDFSEIVSGRSSGSYYTAKPNKMLAPYYAANKIRYFIIPVTSIKLERVDKVEKPFSQLKLTVDFSAFPDVPVLAIDFSKTHKDGIKVPLCDVKAMQFGAGKSVLMDKFIAAEKGDLPMPSIDEPWYIEFSGKPKASNYTPPMNVWVKNPKPTAILTKLAACQSAAMYSGVDVEEELTEVEEFTSVDTDVTVDDSDDDFGSLTAKK